MTSRRLPPLLARAPKTLQLAATLLAAAYMLFIGGSFDATIRFPVQRLNLSLSVALALVWLGVRLWQKARFRATGLELPLLLFALSQWLATLFSAQPRLSLEAATSVVAWSLGFLILCDLLASGWPRQYVIDALLFVALALTVHAAWEIAGWYRAWAEIGQPPPVPYRLTGMLGHPNPTAAAFNLLLPIVLAQMLVRPRWPDRIGLGLLAAGMLAAVLYSSSRAGWIAGAAAIGILAALQVRDATAQLARWRIHWQRLTCAVRLGLLAGLLVALVSIGLSQIPRLGDGSHGSLASRFDMWKVSWTLFTQRPYFGNGPHMYSWLYSGVRPVPPHSDFFHAHSLPLQLLSESGLIGFSAATAVVGFGILALRQRWQQTKEKSLLAGLASGLAGAMIHQSVDYLLGTPMFVFLLVVVGSLAIAGIPPTSPPKLYKPILLFIPLAVVVCSAAFTFPATAWHARGLGLARQNEWAAAAQMFEQAASADPEFPLYWEEAAHAYTRAGNVAKAAPLWQRAARSQPFWSAPHANLAVLAADPVAMEPALALAPENHQYALNTGALYEAQGDLRMARRHYLRALTLNGASANALYWRQTPFRVQVLEEWHAEQPEPTSYADLAQTLLEAGDAQAARALFEQARAEAPEIIDYTVSLARVYWALGDEASAERLFQAAQRLKVWTSVATVELQLFQGDWAAAHGNPTLAFQSYAAVFSAYNDYLSYDSPGSFGYPARAWVVFGRDTLPGDLIPQFARADITPEMDERFARLAEWHMETGQPATACFILERVWREAPLSISGDLWRAACSD